MDVEAFKIENETEADYYLTDLLKRPERRSVSVIEQHALLHVPDSRLRAYFVAKGQEMLGAIAKD